VTRSAADLARAAERVRALLDSATSPTCAHWAVLAAVRGGVHAETCVVARAGTAAPAADARMLLYSFSKTIVAAALLRLVARGMLALDRTPAHWLPEFAPAGRITLRQLLQHTGGIADYGALAAYHEAVRAGDPPWSFAEFRARTAADQLRFPPGLGWSYSNIGYALLQRVLTRAGGGADMAPDMAGVLAREIFAPLGIASASVPTRKADLAHCVFGPSHYLGCDAEAVASRYDPGWIATGVVGASALDAARLLHAVLAGDLLPPALRAEMRRCTPLADSIAGVPVAGRPWRNAGYGLGLQAELGLDVEPCFGHTGGGPGCSPAIYHFPRAVPLTVAVITDGEDIGQAETMAVALARELA
jgi:CubicO group peptidase (beta-lactamase class C family)